jgi:methionine-rich copper-binding protein CopC
MPTLRRLSSSFAAAIAVAMVAIGVAAHGEVLSSNVADPRDGGSLVDLNFPQRAQQFSTTLTGTQISTVRLNVTSSTPAEPFSIELYTTSTSGKPGTPVTTIFSGTGGDLPSSGSSLFTVSGLAIDLAPDTSYYVVMEYGGGAFEGGWWYNFETTGAGDGFRPDNSFFDVDISNWADVSLAQPYRMEVIAVPEPPAIVLSGIGLASAVCLLRRRQT